MTSGPSERIVIPFSRLKCAAILLVASIFVAACAFFASHPEGHARYAPAFIRIDLANKTIVGPRREPYMS